MLVCFTTKKSIYVITPHMRASGIDRDALMKCLLYGQKRCNLVNLVEQKAKQYKQEFDEADDIHSPSRIYNVLVRCLNESMHELFPKQEHRSDPEIKQIGETV